MSVRMFMSWRDVAALKRESIQLLENSPSVPNVSRTSVQLARVLVQPMESAGSSSPEHDEVVLKRVETIEGLVIKHPEMCSEKDRTHTTLLGLALKNKEPLAVVKVLANSSPTDAILQLLPSAEQSSNADPEFEEYLKNKATERFRECKDLSQLRKFCENWYDRAGVAEILLAEFPDIAKERSKHVEWPFLLHRLVADRAPKRVLELAVSCNPQALEEKNSKGFTPLLLACDESFVHSWDDSYDLFLLDLGGVHSLLITPGSASASDEDGNLPIHEYIALAPEPSKQLLEHMVEAYPEALLKQDAEGCTPLQLACRRDDIFPNDVVSHNDVFRPLITSGSASIVSGDGNLPIHDYLGCLSHRSVSVVRQLVEAYPYALAARGENGCTPLLLAFKHRSMRDSVGYNLLITCESVCISSRATGGLPIHEYLRDLSEEYSDLNYRPADTDLTVVEHLVEIDPEALVKFDEQGDTPLLLACRNESIRDTEVFSLLITSDTACISSGTGDLPIHEYVRARSEEANLQVVELMVEAHPESVRRKDKEGKTPLLLLFEAACDSGLLEEMNIARYRTLLERYPEALTEPCNEGSTPFLLVCMYGHGGLSFIRAMVDTYPDCAKVTHERGSTPLHLVCAKPDLPVVLYLAETYPEALMMKDARNGHTPLDVAIDHKVDEEIVTALAELCPELMEPTPVDEKGIVSRLHSFCDRLSRQRDAASPVFAVDQMIGSGDEAWVVSVIETLACSEEVILAADSKGRQPLHLLCNPYFVSRKPLQVLVDRFPLCAQATDINGQTPLHTLMSSSFARSTPQSRDSFLFEDMVDCLLEAHPQGAYAVDKNGKTPLALACENGAPLSVIFRLVSVDPAGCVTSVNPPPRSQKSEAVGGKKRKRGN